MYFIVIYVCLLPLEILFDCCFDLVPAAEITSRGGNSEVTVPPLYPGLLLLGPHQLDRSNWYREGAEGDREVKGGNTSLALHSHSPP